MKSILIKLLLVISTAFYMLLPMQAALAADVILDPACKATPNAEICQKREENTKTNPLLKVIRVAVNIVAAVAGVIAVIMVIVSGIQLITSSGNQENITNARRRLVAALVGVVIIALSWTIISFVISNLIKT